MEPLLNFAFNFNARRYTKTDLGRSCSMQVLNLITTSFFTPCYLKSTGQLTSTPVYAALADDVKVG
jgi:hypothetical protein